MDEPLLVGRARCWTVSGKFLCSNCLVPRWAPSCMRVLCKYFHIPKLTPVLVGNLSARYLHTGDLYVQVFPWMNPQVPM